MDSPLLYGIPTGTPGDIITQKLYFLIPLIKPQIDFLNLPIIRTKYVHINVWSLTHLNWGILVGLLHHWTPRIFNIWTLLIVHTIFEIWEWWAFGYFQKSHGRKIILAEVIDSVLDTVFAVLGYYWARSYPWAAAIFFVICNIVLLSQK